MSNWKRTALNELIAIRQLLIHPHPVRATLLKRAITLERFCRDSIGLFRQVQSGEPYPRHDADDVLPVAYVQEMYMAIFNRDLKAAVEHADDATWFLSANVTKVA